MESRGQVVNSDRAATSHRQASRDTHHATRKPSIPVYSPLFHRGIPPQFMIIISRNYGFPAWPFLF
jgi:hypothetical protein